MNTKTPQTIDQFRSSVERATQLKTLLEHPVFEDALRILTSRAKLLLHRKVEGITSGEAFYEARGYDRAIQDLVLMSIPDNTREDNRPEFYTPDEVAKREIAEG